MSVNELVHLLHQFIGYVLQDGTVIEKPLGRLISYFIHNVI